MPKRIAVVGAGTSGLTSIRACLQEGLDVTCYELTDDIGGIWRYRDEVDPDSPSVFHSVYGNTSKVMSAFSEFPASDELPTYPHHSMWFEYLRDYAVNFDLTRHIRFLHKVTKITMAEELSERDERLQGKAIYPGQWLLEILNTRNNTTSVHVYDGVLVCTGHTTHCRIPPYQGLQLFQGTKMHSTSFRRPEPFAGQRVLVVGFGNSALDIAVECSGHADKVYLSTRRGGWVQSRVVKGGVPKDTTIVRRSKLFWNRFTSTDWRSTEFEDALNSRFEHEAYGIKPPNRSLRQYPITNDFFHFHLLNGTIKMKQDIECFTERGVVFRGESEALVIDTVIFATGYEILMPFLTGMENLEAKLDSVYKLVFPAWLDKPTLAFIGLLTPAAAITPVAEIQARWVTRVFTGKCQLPSKQDMIKDATKVQRDIDTQFYKGFTNRVFIYGPYYNEEIASFIGVRPNLLKLLFTDPKLFWACWAGPMVPCQYRLSGPHPWKGARAAALKAEEAWKSHFRKVGQPESKESSCKTTFIWVGTVGLILAACYMAHRSCQ